MFWVSRRYENSWILLLAFLPPGLVACAAYAFTLKGLDQMALNHRENLTSQLSRM
jgi:hypothetical protein